MVSNSSLASSDEGACTVETPFGFDIRLGLTFVVQAACISLLAVIILLSYILYSSVTLQRGAARHWTTRTHVHWYFLSLLCSEVIQAIGGILNIKWIHNADVTEGAYCVAQGALKQAGDVGVALASLAIATHTFCVIVFHWKPKDNPLVAVIVLATIWIFIILVITISLGVHRAQNYYTDTQYWCWISSRYPGQRIALEYFWMWMAAFINIILYIPIALVLKGYMAVAGWNISFPNKQARIRIVSSTGRDANAHLAIKMLFYPAIYTLTVLPIAIVRWDAFLGHCVPWAATVVADTIFASSGLLNVLLFAFTRPALIPQRHSRGPSGSSNQSGVFTVVSPITTVPPGIALVRHSVGTLNSENLSSLRMVSSTESDGQQSQPPPPTSEKPIFLSVVTSSSA